jgi:hypothetical protein
MVENKKCHEDFMSLSPTSDLNVWTLTMSSKIVEFVN